MGLVSVPYFPKSLYKTAFYYTVFFYLFFLLTNTSFTIMGVDVGDFVKQYLGSFFGVYVVVSAKVFLVSFFLHLTFFSYFFIFIHSLLGKKPKTLILVLLVFFFEFLTWCHSLVLHPQLYGEFFFIRYPKILGFLYFMTDWVSPYLIATLMLCLSLGFILGLFWLLYKKKNKESLFLLFHLFFLLFVHNLGSYEIGLVYFVFLYWLGGNYQRVHLISYGLLLLMLAIFWITPSLYNVLYAWNRPNEPEKPPIFLISADSLRADSVGKRRDGISLTPNLDALAKESFVFLDHHTTIPRTFPSWADLLTGQYSMTHKVRDMFPSPSEKARIGSPAFPTLWQYLSELGYKHYAIGSFAADIFPRANFGFDQVECPPFNAKVMTLQRTAESNLFLLPFLTETWYPFGGMYIPEMDGLSTWGSGKRLVERFQNVIQKEGASPHSVTYFSSVIHFPYAPPYPYYKKFTNPNYYGSYKYLKFVDPTSSKTPSLEDIEQIRGLFDSAVFAFDVEVGELISFLKKKGLYEKSLILVTADHGEALYEDIHGQGHGEHLRGEAVTKVPFFLKLPKDQNKVVHQPNKFEGITSSVDILPTVLDFFGIEVKKALPGKSLLPILGKQDWEEERFVYSETGIWFSDVGDHFFQKQRIPYPNILSLHQVIPEEDYQIMITDPLYRETIAFSKHRSMQSSRYKFLYIPTRQGVVYEMYDRKLDPLNTKNLAPYHPEFPKFKRELYELVKKWEGATLAGEYLLPSPLSEIENEKN